MPCAGRQIVTVWKFPDREIKKVLGLRCVPIPFDLPDAHDVLHQQADTRDTRPAARAEQQRLAAAFDEFDHVAVQADGRHGQDDEEFAQLLERSEERSGHAKRRADRGDD